MKQNALRDLSAAERDPAAYAARRRLPRAAGGRKNRTLRLGFGGISMEEKIPGVSRGW